MIAPLELISINSTTRLFDEKKSNENDFFQKNKSFKDTICELVSNLYFIITILILLNLIVMAVWVYGLVRALMV